MSECHAQAKENPILYAVDYNESDEPTEMMWEDMLGKQVNKIINKLCATVKKLTQCCILRWQRIP